METKQHKPSGLKPPSFKATIPPIPIKPAIGNGTSLSASTLEQHKGQVTTPDTHRKHDVSFLPKLQRSKPVTMNGIDDDDDDENKNSSKTAKATSNCLKTPLMNTETERKSSVKNTVVKYNLEARNQKSTLSTVTTTKHIPAYDYKARYNDLLAKFKSQNEEYENLVEKMKSWEAIPEQLKATQSKLFAIQEELKRTKTEKYSLQEQINLHVNELDMLAKSMTKVKDDYANLKQLFDAHKLDHENIATQVNDLKERNLYLTDYNSAILAENAFIRGELFHANMERKNLHNMVIELRGNIRVFCRVRPPLEEEKEKPLCLWSYVDEATIEVQSSDVNGRNKSGPHNFSFDYVFHPQSRQEDVFEMISPLLKSALDGYNVCIFAYGQTGSGKTYTMEGTVSHAGVIPRSVDLLFTAIANSKRLGWEYEIKATFLEIYNEVLYDLLSNEQKEMEIRMAKNDKNDIYVTNITEMIVQTAEQLNELMEIARMHRATAYTVNNERSSRSHAVTQIVLIGKHEEKNEISIGKINLVDLAGSESPKTSLRMSETKNINRSLAELKNVILALLQKHDHIPYRNSKLTHLLMPSLGGNSKTLMFINVSPFQDCFMESVNSLRFATSVNSCKLAKTKRQKCLNTSNTTSFTEK